MTHTAWHACSLFSSRLSPFFFVPATATGSAPWRLWLFCRPDHGGRGTEPPSHLAHILLLVLHASLSPTPSNLTAPAMRYVRPRSSLCLASVVALSSCCLLLVALLVALLGPAVAAPAPAPAAPPSAFVPSVTVRTPPPGTPAEPRTPSVPGRLALAGTALVRMASTVGLKVIAISNTRLDQLFAPKAERLAVLAASRAGVVDGADGDAPAAGAGAAPAGATPVPPLMPTAFDVGAAPKRDRAADWAAVGLVVVFTGIVLGILGPIVRSIRVRKDLLPVQAEECAGGAVMR